MEIRQGPLVSICVPAYNCERFISDTLTCLCRQTHQHLEIIVVDDGSADQTAAMIKSVTDSRISIIQVVNGGASKARNIAYQRANGNYIVFFDADDLVQPEFVASQLEIMQNREDAIVISGWGRFYSDIAEDFKRCEDLIPYPHSMENWIVQNWYNCQHNTPPGRLFIPRKIIEQAGPWDETLTLNDDFEFFTRIALSASCLIPNPGALYHYRSGINGLSSQKDKRAYLSLFKSLAHSFELAISKYPENSAVKVACANLWQSFIYEVYPHLKDERLVAERAIQTFGGASFNYPAGGLTGILVKLFGWQIAKRIKLILNRNR